MGLHSLASEIGRAACALTPTSKPPNLRPSFPWLVEQVVSYELHPLVDEDVVDFVCDVVVCLTYYDVFFKTYV